MAPKAEPKLKLARATVNLAADMRAGDEAYVDTTDPYMKRLLAGGYLVLVKSR